MSVATVGQLEDLRLLADPVYVEPPASVARLNRELADRFGRTNEGLPFFRLVDARREMVVFQGRMVMRYKSLTEYVRSEERYFLSFPEGLKEVPSFDPETWPEDLQEFRHKLVHVESVFRQKGADFWVMEGWVTGDKAGAGWVEAIDGPVPENGDYRFLWYCRGEHGEYRDPNDSDVEEIARRIRVLQQEDPDFRLTDEFDPEAFNRRIEREQKRQQAEALAKEDADEEDIRAGFRDAYQTLLRSSTTAKARPMPKWAKDFDPRKGKFPTPRKEAP